MPCLVPTSLTDSLTFLKHIADVIPAQYYVVDDANTMLIGQSKQKMYGVLKLVIVFATVEVAGPLGSLSLKWW